MSRGDGRGRRGKKHPPRPAPDLVLGRHTVTALLRHDPGRVRRLYCWSRTHATSIAAIAAEAGIALVTTPPDEQTAANHLAQGVAARVRAFVYRDLDDVAPDTGPPSDGLYLVLDSITDARNLGAILRSAAFFGATAAIIPQDRAAGVNALVERIARGATAVLPVVRVVNVARTLETLRQRGIPSVGTSLGDEAEDLRAIALQRPLAIVLGAEDRGLRPLVARRCDRLVRLEGEPAIGSLNVGAFAAVVLAAVVAEHPS